MTPRPGAGATRRGGGNAAAPARNAVADGPAPRGEAVAAALAAALLAAWAWRGVLAAGFSQDDWLSLARVAGLAPRLTGPWRILANQWFWDAGVAMFGRDARAFHAIVLAAHALGAALLAWLLARRLPAPAAFLAAAVWAVHPAHATALWWTSANSDPFMTLFLLLGTAAFFARGPARWAAPVLFAIALAWKESALLLPAALAALTALGPAPRRLWREIARDRVLWALGAVAIAWAAGIAAFVARLNHAGNAYAAGLGPVARNFATYASWAPSWAPWVQHDSSDAALPKFALMGALVLAAAAAGLAWKPWRERGATGALAAAAALVAPVLPLASHTYRYYLHAPLAAIALANAALFAAATRALAPRARWAAALALATVLTAAAMLVVHALATAPLRLPGSHADRTLDRAAIAAEAIGAVREARLPAHTRLVLWSPQSQAMAREAGRDANAESYEESNVRAALLDGLALRVEFPQLDSVRFVRAFDPADTSAVWGVYRWDGGMRLVRAAELARLLASAPR